MKRKLDVRLFEIIRKFVDVYLPAQRGNSEHTRRAYREALTQLLEFIRDRRRIHLVEINFGMLNREVIEDFLAHLENDRHCTIATRNHRLACIRAFFNFAAEDEMAALPIKAQISKIPLKKKTDSKIVDFMSVPAVKAILSTPDDATAKGLRDKTMLVVLYDTAARIHELLNIRLQDLKLGPAPEVVLHGKGGKIRGVPIAKQSVPIIERYLGTFRGGLGMTSPKLMFFMKHRDEESPMTEDNARKMIAHYGETARMKCAEVPVRVHPHLFRHSRAMHLYHGGMDLALISQWLGHSQFETTLIYAQADVEMKRKAIEEASANGCPLGEMFSNPRFSVSDDETIKRLYGLK